MEDRQDPPGAVLAERMRSLESVMRAHFDTMAERIMAVDRDVRRMWAVGGGAISLLAGFVILLATQVSTLSGRMDVFSGRLDGVAASLATLSGQTAGVAEQLSALHRAVEALGQRASVEQGIIGTGPQAREDGAASPPAFASQDWLIGDLGPYIDGVLKPRESGPGPAGDHFMTE